MKMFSERYCFDGKNKIWARKLENGEFRYSDGDSIESRLLNAVRSCADVSLYSLELQKHCIDWASRYHFTPLRANIVRPFMDKIKGGKTLELGAGCGGVTRFLGELGGEVVAVEGSPRRAIINSERCRDLSNVSIVVDTIQDFAIEESFDVVTLIGVLEYSQVYVNVDDPISHILKVAKGFLKKDGILLLAIENQLGLKYFCGAPEDHVGKRMFGINDSYSQKSVITFGRKELIRRICESGFKKVDTYTPFPDYKLPTAIIYPHGLEIVDVDWNLGTLLANTVAHEPQPFKDHLFSLEQAWQVLARNGLVADLANSFLLVAHPESTHITDDNVLASHYSYPVGRWTSIREHQFYKEDKILVRTRAIYPEFKSEEKWLISDYIAGVKSYDILLKILNTPNWTLADLVAWAAPWVECLRRSVLNSFEKYGKYSSYEKLLPGDFFDAMPTNFILNNFKSSLIDLEWDYGEPIPIEFVLHRGLYLSLIRVVSCEAPSGAMSLRILDICNSILFQYGYDISGDNFVEYIDFFNGFQNKIGGFEANAKNGLVVAMDMAALKIRGNEYKIEKSNNKIDVLKNKKPTYDDKYRIWQVKNSSKKNVYNSFLSESFSRGCSLPFFKFIITFEPGNESWLADIIDVFSLQNYENWRICVISTMEVPDPMFNQVSALSWSTFKDEQEYQKIFYDLSNEQDYDWLSFLNSGICLAEDFLIIITSYVFVNQKWMFFYTDEDSYDEDKNRVRPFFKPDFNIDLLMSEPYIGSACFINRSALDNTIENGCLYNSVFKVFENYGDASIGHIPEIVFHRTGRKENTESYQLALMAYLERSGIDAVVKGGQLPNTFYVEYNWLVNPLVSVIIPTRDRLDLLKPCIDSLISKTSYANYEIIVVDNQSEKNETLDYFDFIQNEYIGKVRVLRYQKSYNYSAINNFAAASANGDYLLLLNNDTVVVQSNWLQRMLNYGQRSDVGIVGARLVFPNQTIQHAGVILGMGTFGVADHPHIGLPLTEPGYMNRAQIVQNLSAVTAACMLIRKSVYVEVGGLDEENFKVLFNDVDLCLKVRERGYKIVWTPYATVVHHGSSSIKADKNPDKAKRARQEADKMLEKWLPQLANDPAYNRNLSLKHRHFQIETETDVTWNVDFHDRPRVYAFPANESGIGEYRVRAPLRALTHASRIESSLLPNHSATLIPDIVEIERVKPDILLLQNGTADYLIHAWQQYRKFNDVFMIYSQDDLVHMLPGKHPLQSKWPKDLRRRLSQLMSHSDRLIVATEPLKEAYSKYISDIKLVPNYLEKARWLDLRLNKQSRNGNKLRVGWAGGGQHHGDLEFIAPVIEATKDEVDWIFMGMCLDQIRPYIKEYHAGVAFDLYPQKLADLDLDLAIAPLEYNNFNMAKTNLRLLEYGVLGWPVLCSDITPYRNAPVTLVGNNVNHWIKAIREKIHEPEALFIEGQALQQWVFDNFLLEDHLDEWFAALTP